MKKLLLLLATMLALHTAWADEKKVYNEAANAREEIQAALKAAKDGGKSMLVVFGANWCGDCKMLDMEMHQGELQRLVNERLVVVKVDVGRFDRNKDVAVQYDPNILKNGIPSVALVKADGSVAYRTTGGELADARKMGREGVTQFFVTMLGNGGKS
jgi:thioredoxin 1